MRIYRINEILKNCHKTKYKNGFIKYLSSLDFDEYKYLMQFYIKVFSILEKINSGKKVKFLNKQWRINFFLKQKREKFFKLFIKANSEYFKDSCSFIIEQSAKIVKLTNDINEIKKTLDNVNGYSMILNINPTKEQSIIFFIKISNTIYLSEELERMKSELYNLRNNFLFKTF